MAVGYVPKPVCDDRPLCGDEYGRVKVSKYIIYSDGVNILCDVFLIS
jgi:hypothetical protein